VLQSTNVERGGEARETERWEGRRREDGERGSTGDREMGGNIAWLYGIPCRQSFFREQSENRETDTGIGEERNREAPKRGNHSSVYSL
jgi:hypothetical protein